jgi:hypothetical protein
VSILFRIHLTRLQWISGAGLLRRETRKVNPIEEQRRTPQIQFERASGAAWRYRGTRVSTAAGSTQHGSMLVSDHLLCVTPVYGRVTCPWPPQPLGLRQAAARPPTIRACARKCNARCTSALRSRPSPAWPCAPGLHVQAAKAHERGRKRGRKPPAAQPPPRRPEGVAIPERCHTHCHTTTFSPRQGAVRRGRSVCPRDSLTIASPRGPLGSAPQLSEFPPFQHQTHRSLHGRGPTRAAHSAPASPIGTGTRPPLRLARFRMSPLPRPLLVHT